METIQVFSSFSHSFNCSDGGDITYKESKWVKRGNSVICIDSLDTKRIGQIHEPEYRIELWATETFKERLKQDFVNLKKDRQVIHYCNGKTVVVDKKNINVIIN